MTGPLGHKRATFTKNMARLILWIDEQMGQQCYAEEVKRSPAKAAENAAEGAGISNSLHLLGLAVDLSIISYDEYSSDIEIYSPAGQYWKSLDPLNRWGGDFNKPDADHFSMEHNGVK